MKVSRSFVCLSIPRRISLFLPVLFLSVGFVVGVVRIALDGIPALWQLGLLAIAAVLVIYVVPALRMCHRIEVGERSISFVRQFSHLVVPAGTIAEVSPSIWAPSALSIRARNGVVVMPSAFDGFTEVIAAIREQNLSAKVRGC